jgi:triosephosphate isomerase
MSRIPMMVGNWKMNTLRADAVALAEAIRKGADAIAGVEKIVCPPFPYVIPVADALADSTVAVGVQNLYWEEKGAFTGEVSVTQAADIASYAIIGHSERRQYFGETDETVNRRVKAALAHGLKPIMCVGETLEERDRNETAQVIVTQTHGGLDGVDIDAGLVIAYEPVWAIGTGLAADGPTAESAIALIRETVRDIAGGVADSVRILYGGSVTPENIADHMSQPDIDGGLVGGASLKADSFLALIESAAAAATQRA